MVLFGTVVRRRRSRLPQLTSRLDHTGSQKQREGLRKGDCSELYFVTKHNHIGKCTMGSLAGAGSEGWPGSERRWPAAGRAASRQNTECSASVQYERSGPNLASFESVVWLGHINIGHCSKLSTKTSRRWVLFNFTNRFCWPRCARSCGDLTPVIGDVGRVTAISFSSVEQQSTGDLNHKQDKNASYEQ